MNGYEWNAESSVTAALQLPLHENHIFFPSCCSGGLLWQDIISTCSIYGDRSIVSMTFICAADGHIPDDPRSSERKTLGKRHGCLIASDVNHSLSLIKLIKYQHVVNELDREWVEVGGLKCAEFDSRISETGRYSDFQTSHIGWGNKILYVRRLVFFSPFLLKTLFFITSDDNITCSFVCSFFNRWPCPI